MKLNQAALLPLIGSVAAIPGSSFPGHDSHRSLDISSSNAVVARDVPDDPWDLPKLQEPACEIAPLDKSVDVTPKIHEAIEKCGDGGSILMKHHEWSFHSVLDLSGCKNCQIYMLNTTVKATVDMEYWGGKRAMIQMYNTSGAVIEGFFGTFDGNGEAVWTGDDPNYQSPVLFEIDSSENITISTGINFEYPQKVGYAINNSNNIASGGFCYGDPFSGGTKPDTTCLSVSDSTNLNLTGGGAGLHGPCIELKGGVDNVLIQNPNCYGTYIETLGHGIVFGTLDGDREEGSRDIKNVVVNGIQSSTNIAPITFRHCSSSSGAPPAQISNITIDRIQVATGNEYGLLVEQCDEGSDAELSDILFKRYYARISNDEIAGIVDCPDAGICDFQFNHFNVTAYPWHNPLPLQCTNFDDPVGVTCVEP
ncbi:hypothetical protein FQN54_003148 [Arachnomyces sp. PD_36]|nr:hypothetical protein FQN54_003148 [Arachnomyces sp. PD_36]